MEDKVGLYVRFGAAPSATNAAPVTGTNVPGVTEWSER